MEPPTNWYFSKDMMEKAQVSWISGIAAISAIAREACAGLSIKRLLLLMAKRVAFVRAPETPVVW